MPDTETLIGDIGSSSIAATEAGISMRQLDLWASEGIITPRHTPVTGRGNHRVWTLDEVKVLRLLGQLSALRASLKVLEAASRALRGVTIRHIEHRLLVITPQGEAKIMDGKDFLRSPLPASYTLRLAAANDTPDLA